MRKLEIYGQDETPESPLPQKNPVRPAIEKVFENGYPENYRPWADAWSLSREDLLGRLPDGTFALTQMDISISPDNYVKIVNEGMPEDREPTVDELVTINSRARKYYGTTCGIGCGHCFECSSEIRNTMMKTEEVYDMLKEAKELGLRHVKFLGPGELMHNPRLFEILDFMRDNDIKIGIFTKGVSLGDDKKAREVFGISAKEVCDKIASYGNVTILFGLTSFDRTTEQKRVDSRNFPRLFEIRNRALENLAAAGLNKDPRQQRLAILCAPILRDNIDEVIDIYLWGLERNIPVVVTPTMISGMGTAMKEISDTEFKEKNLVDLYRDIYATLIRKNILTLEQVEEEGISSYAGYACNQFISGMFIRKDGQAQACPGNDSAEFLYARDVRKDSLKEIWRNSAGYKIREKLISEGKLTLNQPCYAKSEEIPFADGRVRVRKGHGSIPEGFYEKVLQAVREKIAKEILLTEPESDSK